MSMETAGGIVQTVWQDRGLWFRDARGVRPGRQLPGEPVPPAARDLGDRGGATARLTRRRLTVPRAGPAASFVALPVVSSAP